VISDWLIGGLVTGYWYIGYWLLVVSFRRLKINVLIHHYLGNFSYCIIITVKGPVRCTFTGIFGCKIYKQFRCAAPKFAK
jgi:hypothetical protein